MKQSSSFLERGRDLRDEKEELVSRKEMDDVSRRGISPGVLNLQSLAWGPQLSFWRLMNPLKSSVSTVSA